VVTSIPASAETDIESVAKYIAARESDPFMLVKALHDYVADRVAYDVAGVILVDMESYSLHEVDFGLSPKSSRSGFIVGAMLGIAFALGAGILTFTTMRLL
ncbi:MAG: hypothetical protein AAFY60_21405, partial [Myxococcota bacterium]